MWALHGQHTDRFRRLPVDLEDPGLGGGAPNIWQPSCAGADSFTDKLNGSRITSYPGG